jgi:hypothetical protein
MTQQLCYSNFHIQQHISKQGRGKEKGGPTLQNRWKTEKKGLNIFSEVLGNSSTCNLAQLADAPLLSLWNFRSDDITAISKHEKGKPDFKKNNKTTKKDWQAVSRTYTCSVTFNSNINGIWPHGITSPLTSPVVFSFFFPQFFKVTWVVIIQKTT